MSEAGFKKERNKSFKKKNNLAFEIASNIKKDIYIITIYTL